MYGLMVILSISVANILLKVVCRKKELDIAIACTMEIYGGIGAILGAKILYCFECYLINQVILEVISCKNGYSFYGGVILGIVFIKIGCLIHRFCFEIYVRELCFIVPIMHSIWKLGCYFAGCCYGIETASAIGQKFTEGSIAPTNVSLVPIQLIECMCLLILSMFLWFLNRRNKLKFPISMYLVGYAIPRFFVEFFRENEKYMGLSVAQWISLMCVLIVGIKYVINDKRRFRR